MSHEAERDEVIAVARSWIGTPFHNNAGLKGIGVDCAHFLACVFQEAGVVERFEVERYSPQWFLHRDEERFMRVVMQKAKREIGEAEAQKADIVLYKLGRLYAHGAIIIEWPGRVIHAHMLSRGVVESGGRDGDLSSRATKFFTLWD